jgi:large subunit ribosomal protein L14e
MYKIIFKEEIKEFKMSLMDVGRVCYKLAGREAGKLCVIVDVKNKNNVMIDGNVKRRLCNVSHLEPTENIIKIKKGISTTELHELMKHEKLKVETRKQKTKEKKVKPIKAKKKEVKKVKKAKK